jgi:hypothetical protein
MRSLNLPTYSFKIKSVEGKEYIYDNFRKKFLYLTPEEWVRQNFACFLVNEYSYPRGRIVLEKSLKYNKLSKRCDALVYNHTGEPVLMVECKAPGVKINANVFDQIAVYNMTFKVEYLIVTNGLNHYCAKIDFEEAKINFLKAIPTYSEISPV